MAGFNTDLLIEPEILAERLRTGEYCVVDARGASEFVENHIPGALHLPITKLQNPQSERGALLPFEEITSNIGAAGIEPDSSLVFYDDSGLVPSARWFWILKKLGHKHVALLNGGIIRWRELGLPLERGEPNPTAKRYDAEIQEGIVADKSDVYAAMASPDAVIVDARTVEEFEGRTQTAARDGHIPGAVHVDWQNHINDLFDPTFRDLAELSTLYEERGVKKDSHVLVYCRSGSRSSHSYFTLRLLGYKTVSNYAGSWLEWGNDTDTPIEVS